MKKYQIMISNIRFKIIAGKLTKFPNFTRFLPEKMPDYIIRPRDRGQAEAKCLRPRPRPNKILASIPLWPRGLSITGDWSAEQVRASVKCFTRQRSLLISLHRQTKELSTLRHLAIKLFAVIIYLKDFSRSKAVTCDKHAILFRQ